MGSRKTVGTKDFDFEGTSLNDVELVGAKAVNVILHGHDFAPMAYFVCNIQAIGSNDGGDGFAGKGSGMRGEGVLERGVEDKVDAGNPQRFLPV